jgi:hypothetical protein|tara:strand:+ start:105 stop:1286 length:1182 start_codon:yes stop_codon:yes gene_type:complete
MKIFNFIKKIFENEKIEEVEEEKLDFSNIGDWINTKEKEIKTKEGKVLTEIKERSNIFLDNFKEKVDILRGVNLDLKKEEYRIKSMSEEGRKKYLGSVDIFINNLDKLEKDDLEKFSKGIDKIFLDFNKNSYKNYERATILIGKEIAEVKETLRDFSRDLTKILEENKWLIDSLKISSIIKLKLNELTNLDDEAKRIEEVITNLNSDLSNMEEENKKIKSEVEKIEKSEKYIENLTRQNNVKSLEEELKKEIFFLRQIIDFKALANFYHIFEERMNIVKKHKEDFQTNFQKDDGETILSLLNESKLNNEKISDKMVGIKIKKEEILENEQEISRTPDLTIELHSKKTKVILDIGNLKNEKTMQEKRQEKLKLSKEDLIESIKERAEILVIKLR